MLKLTTAQSRQLDTACTELEASVAALQVQVAQIEWVCAPKIAFAFSEVLFRKLSTLIAICGTNLEAFHKGKKLLESVPAPYQARIQGCGAYYRAALDQLTGYCGLQFIDLGDLAGE